VLVGMAVVLVPCVLLASWHTFDGDAGEENGVPPRSARKFFAWILLLEFFMVGVFAATDVFLFYVFFEAMLVPMYFIIGSFGGPKRQYAAMKFFLYSLLGGLLMLASVIGLYVTTGSNSFAIGDLIGQVPDNATQRWLFLGFFLAFAIKAPLVPFHTWLPDAGAEAPAGGAALLVGVLDKVGTFGFLRYCLPLFPAASRSFAMPIMILSVIGVLYAAFLAIGQRDMKRLVAYTSVAHFGFIGLGIFAFTTQAGTGAVLYMVNHGLSTGAVFLVVGLLIARGKSRNVDDYGGAAKTAPILSGQSSWSALLFCSASCRAVPSISSTTGLIATLSRVRSILPASILDRSRTPLIRFNK
jgi:NADH-quinone oxidoreductase subunit M